MTNETSQLVHSKWAGGCVAGSDVSESDRRRSRRAPCGWPPHQKLSAPDSDSLRSAEYRGFREISGSRPRIRASDPARQVIRLRTRRGRGGDAPTVGCNQGTISIDSAESARAGASVPLNARPHRVDGIGEPHHEESGPQAASAGGRRPTRPSSGMGVRPAGRFSPRPQIDGVRSRHLFWACTTSCATSAAGTTIPLLRRGASNLDCESTGSGDSHSENRDLEVSQSGNHVRVGSHSGNQRRKPSHYETKPSQNKNVQNTQSQVDNDQNRTPFDHTFDQVEACRSTKLITCDANVSSRTETRVQRGNKLTLGSAPQTKVDQLREQNDHCDHSVDMACVMIAHWCDIDPIAPT